jgi:Arc/MetJ-type ribon-helix-helix transcriptional regulator
MSYVPSTEVLSLVQQHIASGRFASEEDVLLEALRVLDEKEQTIAAVAAGYEDVKAGRHRPLADSDAGFRRRHGLA